MTGRLRLITNALFLVANFALAPQVKQLGFDPYVHWRTLIAFTAVHSIDALLGLWLWKAATSATRMRQLTYASVVLETIAVVGASWVYGTVNSPFLGVELVFISIYRLAIDFRIGGSAFGIALVVQ